MPTDRLTTATILYLLLPVWLFLLGWLQVYVALPLCLLTVWAVGKVHGETNLRTDTAQSRREQLILLAASLFYLWISGIGGFTNQHGDYEKHNQLFADLIRYSWPVVYKNQRYNNPFLCYYVAYYLPTAALARLLHLPLRYADWLSAVWGWAGLWLSLRWAVRLSGPYRLWMGIGLLVLAGIEIPYRLGPWLWVEHGGDWSAWWTALWHGSIPTYSRYVPPRYFFSNGLWQHSLESVPLLHQLQQTPQHAIGGWLGVSVLLDRQQRGSNASILLLIGAALLLWSPFTAIGLAVLVLLRQPMLLRTVWSEGPLVGASAGLLFVFGLFFLGHEPLGYTGFVVLEAWQQPADAWLHMGYFALNYGLPTALLYVCCRRLPTARFWIKLAIQSAVLMTLFSVYYVGICNDFYMRTIIPAQWAFHLSVANGLAIAVQHGLLKRPATLALAGWVLVGMFMPVRLVAYTIYALQFPRKLSSTEHATTLRANISEYEGSFGEPAGTYSAQYVGRRDSWFFRFLVPPQVTNAQTGQASGQPE